VIRLEEKHSQPIITSPQISQRKDLSVGGNYYFSLIFDGGKLKICFPICTASILHCFVISGIFSETEGIEPGWISNHHFSNGIEIVIPPDRPGLFISRKGRFEVTSSDSTIFWPISHAVRSMRSPWSSNPVYFSEVSGKLPAIAFSEVDDGTIITVGDTPDRAILSGISLRRIGMVTLRSEADNFLLKFDSLHGNSRLISNAMLSIFLSNSRCIDAQENCIMASKSPYYYVSAGYWARDFIFWVLPVIERFDEDRARELIDDLLKKYWRNRGIHALYLDGRILYDGFELDQLAYHFLLLAHAIKYGVLSDSRAASLSKELLADLSHFKNDKFNLYSTVLNSSDDPVEYPYVTYNNVALWYSMRYLAGYLKGAISERLIDLAEYIRRDIMINMIKEGQFVYSTDLAGKYNFYDDPTGSILLFPYFGFSESHDPVFRKTANWIMSEKNPYYIQGRYGGLGNMHVDHPWLHHHYSMILSSLSDARILESLPMDHGLACETIDENDGGCLTGIHFPGSSGMYVQASLKAKT